jgi:hypothetical protein
MIIKKILIITLIFTSIDSHAQDAEFKYWKELCDCKAIFDSTKIPRAQLRNTFDYLWWAPNIDSDGTAWTLDKIDDLNIETLRQECSERINKLQTLEFVNDSFWTDLIEERIKYYKSTCLLREYTILAYSNPDTLLHYDLVDENCIYYRDVLIAGGQKLIDAWVKYKDDWVEKNGYVERNQKKFDKEFNSPRREDYARLELMLYGWWNSANHILPHVNSTYNYAEEFERLFITVDCECDEP